MSEASKKYPENSVLAQILMNVYADIKEKTVTILYDKTLTQELVSLEYAPTTQELTFVFKNGKMPFGAPLSQDVAAIAEQIKKITLIQIDLKTKQPVTGLEVPLTII